MAQKSKSRKPLVLPPGAGRSYPMGRMQSIFKADGEETGQSYSVSEWWLDPNTKGPGVHDHEDDHIWYVIGGTMSIFINNEWHNMETGSLALIPGGVPHDFENRSLSEKAGILSFNNRAGFEEAMPRISKYVKDHPPEDAV